MNGTGGDNPSSQPAGRAINLLELFELAGLTEYIPVLPTAASALNEAAS